VFWLFGPNAGYYALSGVATLSVALGLSGLTALVLWLRRQALRAVLLLAAGFIVVNYLFVMRVLPAVERTKPVPPLVRTLHARAGADAKIGYFNMGLQSFVYYVDRGPIEEIGSFEQAEGFFADRREAWALMGQPEWDAVHAVVSHTCIVDHHPLSAFDAKFPDIVKRQPPIDVLLVKNHCDK